MIQGKPDSNKCRYIYTKVDKIPQFLVLEKCNLCPFLINNFKGGEALCAKYINTKPVIGKRDNFITTVHGYIQRKANSQKLDIFSDIYIPDWCELPNHLTKISVNDVITTIKNGNLYMESGQNYSNMVRVIDSSFVKYDDDNENLISKTEESTYINHNNSTPTSYKNKCVCSFCGEEKEDVNRNDHIGMCDVCWGKFKFSHPKRYNAKINNFRLKRKEDWKDKDYKKINV